MDEYDLIIAGGGIAGSVAAKFAAQAGLKTLFVERHKTPRNKPCSGIQFAYFEKILDEKIPKERLCNFQLDKIRMFLPDGKNFGSKFKMLNFMRKPFDDWLNIRAQESGAEFIDDCVCQEVKEIDEHIIVVLTKPKEKKTFECKSRYFVDATGLRPKIRNQIKPLTFTSGFQGATLNYYIDGDADLDPETLYQFWNIEWNNAMFAWVYTKTLDDGKDYWCVGTGYNNGIIKDRQELFYNHIKETYNLTGEIVKREGYKTSMDLFAEDRVWLGRDRILMAGDAAGLIDVYRGVGMDAAALSGRIVAKAIVRADKKNTKAIDEYAKLMKGITSQTKKNQKREISNFKNNDELQKHMMKTTLRMGVTMMIQMQLNKLRRAEKLKLLPP